MKGDAGGGGRSGGDVKGGPGSRERRRGRRRPLGEASLMCSISSGFPLTCSLRAGQEGEEGGVGREGGRGRAGGGEEGRGEVENRVGGLGRG